MSEQVVKAIRDLGKAALDYEKREAVLDRDDYLIDGKKAFIFFLKRMFYRGRFDWLSQVYANAALSNVGKYLSDVGWRVPDISRDEFELGLEGCTSKEAYKFPRADLKMVYRAFGEVITNLDTIQEPNIVKYTKECIGRSNVTDVYRIITRVPYIKDKLACLFIRDVGSLYDMLDGVSREEVRFFLPVDTWVRNLAKQLELVAEGGNECDDAVKDALIQATPHTEPCSFPIFFDHGLWMLSQLQYLGRNFEFVKNNMMILEIISHTSIFREQYS